MKIFLKKNLASLNRAVYFALGITALPWIVMLAETYTNSQWYVYGLYPKDPQGLLGIITMPFLHSDWPHLYSNSGPLLILGASLFFFFPRVAVKVMLIGWAMSGILTWLIGKQNYHIGASGIVYMLAAFIFWSGVFKKHRPLIALSLLVIFLYGSLIWGLFPLQPFISWEGHLAGFITGLALAYYYKSVPYAFEPEEEPEEPEEPEFPYWLEEHRDDEELPPS